jgi:hypothetical protein
MLRQRRQERRDDLEVEVSVVLVAVGSSLQDADLVVQLLDHAEADRVVGMAVRHDAISVPLDHVEHERRRRCFRCQQK